MHNRRKRSAARRIAPRGAVSADARVARAMLVKLRAGADVRAEVVLRARQAIEAGKYEDAFAMQVAARRAMDEG